MSPFLIILSAPSGTGKTTIAKALLATRRDIAFSVSATTRPPRDAEEPGVDYHFMDRGNFEARLESGDFLEWAEYGGHLYGTLSSQVEEILRSGRHVVLDIETRGARVVRERSPTAVSIFILPPSTGTLVQRLRERSTEGPADLERRLARAIEEIGEAADYDYIVINADRDQAVADVTRIIDAEAHRPIRLPGIDELLNNLRDGLSNEVQSVRQG